MGKLGLADAAKPRAPNERSSPCLGTFNEVGRPSRVKPLSPDASALTRPSPRPLTRCKRSRCSEVVLYRFGLILAGVVMFGSRVRPGKPFEIVFVSSDKSEEEFSG